MRAFNASFFLRPNYPALSRVNNAIYVFLSVEFSMWSGLSAYFVGHEQDNGSHKVR